MVSMKKSYKSQIYIMYVRDKWTNISISTQPILMILFLLERVHIKGSLVKVWLSSEYEIRLKLKKSIFFIKKYNYVIFSGKIYLYSMIKTIL